MFRNASLAAALLALPIASLSSAPGDLQSTLAKLDAASANFHNAEAKVHRESYNALIKGVDDTQDGSIYVIRAAGRSQVGLRTDGANARIVEYKNGVVKDYIPAAKCYNTVNKAGIDTYLSLGFGGSGKDLQNAWDITDLGDDPALKAEKLDLVPKDPGVKANVTHVTIWIDLAQDVTRKLIFYSPSGDYNTATYSEVHLNQKIDTKPYEIKGSACH